MNKNRNMHRSKDSFFNNEDNEPIIFVAMILIFYVTNLMVNLVSYKYVQISITVVILAIDKSVYESIIRKPVSDTFSRGLSKVKYYWTILYASLRLVSEYQEKVYISLVSHDSSFSDVLKIFNSQELIFNILMGAVVILIFLILLVILWLLLNAVYYIWNFFIHLKN